MEHPRGFLSARNPSVSRGQIETASSAPCYGNFRTRGSNRFVRIDARGDPDDNRHISWELSCKPRSSW